MENVETPKNWDRTICHNDERWTQRDRVENDSALKKQIFEKVRKRMAELQIEGAGCSHWRCVEAIPDIIVTDSAQSSLFEPQNMPASAWLHKRYDLGMQNAEACSPMRAHPCERQKIIDDLRQAGFEVLTEAVSEPNV